MRRKLEGARLRRAMERYRDAEEDVRDIARVFGLSARVLHRYAAKAGIRRLHWKTLQEVTTEKDITPGSCGDE
jgi:hypothetical protein